MTTLELREVSKTYGEGATEVQALQNVSLSVDAGVLVAVMGASGSGKSTLLTIAGSLEDPTSGQVLVGGQDLAADVAQRQGPAAAPLDRLRVPGLQPAGRPHRAGERRAAARARRPVRRARRVRPACKRWTSSGWPIGPAHFPDQLSGGERQRVSIARAVVGERSLLLADEPSGALDSANGEAVMRLVLAACRRGVAAVVVTHDAQLASWADRVVFLRDGRIVDQTAPPPGPESLLHSDPAAEHPMSTTVLDRRHPPLRPIPAACPPGGRWCAGRGGCSGASGASSCWCSR